MDTPDVLAWRDGHIEALDQTALPHQVRVLRLTTVDQLVEAITTLAVRGAPVLGAAGALGVALAVHQGGREGWDEARLDAEVKRIGDARPTAVNLRREVAAVAALIPQGRAAVEAAAQAVVGSSITASHQISRRGAAYLRDACGSGRLRIHTHCNTGSLACLGWGTALGVIRALHDEGALSHVIVDETRPLLQGARLTCWELGQLGIEHRLACDGAGPFLISQGLADAVVVGADRVAANGDVANKIGTYGLALAAHRAGRSGRDQGAQRRVRHHSGRARLGGGHREKAHPERGLAHPLPPVTRLPRRASAVGRPREAELGLQVCEAASTVDPDGRVRRVGHDDEGARAEHLAPVAARMPDERPGQALAPGRRVGLDILVAGEPAACVAQPELREQPTAGKGAEPGAVSRLGHLPPRRGPAVLIFLGPV